MKNYLLLITAVVMCAFSFTNVQAACHPVDVSYLQSGSPDFGEMTTDATNVWSWDATYNCAKATRSGGAEGHLFTPMLDLSGTETVTIKFAHTHKYAGTPSEELTLWVTADYKGDYVSSSWKQLTISPYGANTNWTFVDVTIDVPVSWLGEKTVFCFKYISTASNYATWEIKNLQIASTCPVIECHPVNASYLLNGASGLGEVTTDATDIWSWDSSYSCAKARKQGGVEGHLFTPALDLTGSDEVTLKFSHTHRYAGTPSEEFTLWVTDDYKGNFDETTWEQLTISPYGTNTNWTFVDVTINVPVSYVGANTVFCFRYISTSSNYGTWEIRNINIASICPDGGSVSPVPLPETGDGRLKVCAQNLQNYYYNYNTGRGNYTPEEFADKTHKIVDAMLWLNADIYAFCELEAKPIILQQLADSMNIRTDDKPYVAVTDEIDEDWDSEYNNNLKSGFIYRKDKVKTIGANHPATSAAYYKKVLRIQVFEELESHERFTLSMNHFKAKDSSDDEGNGKRVTNANQLLQGLQDYALDPDILILGDLNCQVGEEPLEIIEEAGYVEQLLKYNSGAYSHCYNGGELIDHVYANASMEEQVTGAGLFHISTGCGADAANNADHRYSDHDPYMVAINLASTHPTECEPMQMSYLPTGASDLGAMTAVSVSGQWFWRYQSSYGATCQDRGGEDWLLTPVYDLSKAGTVNVTFDHAINNANNMTTQQTLWVTGDFSSVEESEWTQLTIPTYPAGTSWTFVNTSVDVPLSALGANTVFGFKYDVPADAAKNTTWEIKNLSIAVTCDNTPDGLEAVREDMQASKIIREGHLYIVMPDGSRYNVIGVKVQ